MLISVNVTEIFVNILKRTLNTGTINGGSQLAVLPKSTLHYINNLHDIKNFAKMIYGDRDINN